MKTFLPRPHSRLINMLKETYHPNAYLSETRNNKRGLGARTRVIGVLEKHSGGAKIICDEAHIPYRVALHHLKLLEIEGIVKPQSNKPYIWTLTGIGQRRLLTQT